MTDKTDPGKTDPGKTDLGAGLSDTSPFVQDARDHFAVSAIVDRAGDTVINKVVANVVDGKDPLADFGDLGLSILTRETMAIAQYGIGELGHGNANWEGSVGHLLLHGGVGCVALEVLNGNCTAGVFAGASSAHLAGSNLSDKQKLELAPIVGALAALPFANGDAINVSFAGLVSRSGIENNYLTHAQVGDMLEQLRQCGRDEECRDDVYGYFRAKSLLQDQELAACTDLACVEFHLGRANEGKIAYANIQLSERLALGTLFGISDVVDVDDAILNDLRTRFLLEEAVEPPKETRVQAEARYRAIYCQGISAETCETLVNELYYQEYVQPQLQAMAQDFIFGELENYAECRGGSWVSSAQACTNIVIDILGEKKLSAIFDAAPVIYDYYRNRSTGDGYVKPIQIDTSNAVKVTPEYEAPNNPAASTTYELDIGTTFKTGEGGYVDEVTYRPVDSPGVRDSRQTAVGKEGIAGDVGGHIQACHHGGTCDRFNLFPQNSSFNNSAYKRWENEITRSLQNGDDVGNVTVRLNRADPHNPRPDSLTIEYEINGVPFEQRFNNQAGQ